MRANIEKAQEGTTSIVGAVLRRLGVHFASILAVVLFLDPAPIEEQLAAYIGLICLFPRGRVTSPQWYGPTVSGVLQALILVFIFPLGYAVFFGGFQTWAQRLLLARGRMGWEWSVLPMLLICFNDALPIMENASMNILLLLSFPVLLAVGWMLLRRSRRAEQSALRSKLLEQAKQTLKAAVARRSLPEEMQAQAELLLKQAGEYSRWGAGDPDDPFPLAPRVLATAQSVDKIARTSSLNAEAEKNSDISRWINSARRMDRRKPTADGTSPQDLTLKDMRALTALLIEKNGTGLAKSSPQAGEYAEYEKSARELLQKKSVLPEDAAAFVEKIAFSTLNIVESMRGDSADVAPGKRFLDKYLPITHRILDEHKRLSGMKVSSGEIKDSLERSHEMLDRLAMAFADEYAALQQNDAINFNAELNALDAVLKMQGH